MPDFRDRLRALPSLPRCGGTSRSFRSPGCLPSRASCGSCPAGVRGNHSRCSACNRCRRDRSRNSRCGHCPAGTACRAQMSRASSRPADWKPLCEGSFRITAAARWAAPRLRHAAKPIPAASCKSSAVKMQARRKAVVTTAGPAPASAWRPPASHIPRTWFCLSNLFSCVSACSIPGALSPEGRIVPQTLRHHSRDKTMKTFACAAARVLAFPPHTLEGR